MQTKGLFTSFILIVSLLIASCDTKPAKPSEKQPSEAETAPSSTETKAGQAPGDQLSTEEVSSGEDSSSLSETTEVSTETNSSETPITELDPKETIKKIQLDYLKFLQTSMESAMAEQDLEKTDKIRKEMIKAVTELNALEKSETVEEESAESSTQANEDSSSADSGETTPSEDSPEIMEDSSTSDQLAEQTPEPAVEEETQEKKDLPAEQEQEAKPVKYKILIDVVPKTSSKRIEYDTVEELSLKIKLTNQNLNDPTGPITLYYFILGKGTRSSNEIKLLDTGEKTIELGNAGKDRFYEYTTDTYFNKYWNGGGSSAFKYDIWYVAVADSDGKMIASKTNRPQFNDFEKFMNVKRGVLYDKNLFEVTEKSRY